MIIPFDFEAKFDDGHYGRLIGDMLWQKLDRQGDFILPESMHDVRDYCRNHHFQPSPNTSLETMKKVVQDDFGAQIAIWGSVERAPKAEGDIYDLVIKCVDLSAQPEPKVIFESKNHTNSVSEIQHLYVKKLLNALNNRQPDVFAQADPNTEANWKNNPNLIVGGDFQSGLNGVPKGWEPVAGQKREPLGKLVQWVTEEGNANNKIISFTFDAVVGNNEGVMYYSDYFPIQEGATYRFQCRWKSNGPKVKVFIKCYDVINEQYEKHENEPTDQKTLPWPGKEKYSSETTQRREVYRSQQNLKGPTNTRNIHNDDFTPKHTKFSLKWGRIMLYAYHGGGEVQFDNIVVKQIAPPPKELNKEPRHSLETNGW
ncbi:MAG TPA: hypothetical protein VIH42_00905 [Thermoguttaceae bacterium]